MKLTARFIILASTAIPVLALASSGVSLAPARLHYNADIRPILSENCFQCHGPDKGTRMADLRLDTREGLSAHRPSGIVVSPGDPKSSLLYQRISQEKAALRMDEACAQGR